MRTFVIVPRGKKYWIEATNEDGVRQMIIAFATEDAALRCLKDFQQREEREGTCLLRHHQKCQADRRAGSERRRGRRSGRQRDCQFGLRAQTGETAPVIVPLQLSTIDKPPVGFNHPTNVTGSIQQFAGYLDCCIAGFHRTRLRQSASFGEDDMPHHPGIAPSLFGGSLPQLWRRRQAGSALGDAIHVFELRKYHGVATMQYLTKSRAQLCRTGLDVKRTRRAQRRSTTRILDPRLQSPVPICLNVFALASSSLPGVGSCFLFERICYFFHSFGSGIGGQTLI